jgi:hypothetical protein
MLLIDDILLFPVNSICWVFREIGEIAQKELAGEAESITQQLRMLYMQLETGRMNEEAFAVEEKMLLDRLEAIENRRPNRSEDNEEAGESDADEVEEDEEPDEVEEGAFAVASGEPGVT